MRRLVVDKTHLIIQMLSPEIFSVHRQPDRMHPVFVGILPDSLQEPPTDALVLGATGHDDHLQMRQMRLSVVHIGADHTAQFSRFILRGDDHGIAKELARVLVQIHMGAEGVGKEGVVFYKEIPKPNKIFRCFFKT